MKIRLIVILIIYYITSFSQQKETENKQQRVIDRLLFSLNQTKTDTSKARILILIGAECFKTNLDSALKYFEKSLALSKQINYTEYEAKAYKQIGKYYYFKGDYDLASDNYQKSINKFEMLLSKTNKKNVKNVYNGISDCYINIGLIYLDKGNYDISNNYFQKSLSIKEKIKDSIGISTCYTNIGIVHLENKNSNRAIEFFQKALDCYKKLNDKKSIAMCFANIGIAFTDKKIYKPAIEFFNNALIILIEINDKKSISACYNNIGEAYKNFGNIAEAKKYFTKALLIKEEIGDKYGTTVTLNCLADLLIVMADSLHDKQEKQKTYSLAVNYAEKELALSKEIGAVALESKGYNCLSQALYGLENYKSSIEFLRKFIDTKERIFNQEKTKSIEDLDKKYQTEKKQQQIELQNEKLKKSEIEIKFQTKQKYGFIVGFLLMLVLILVVFKSYKAKKKANIILTHQKEEINIQAQELIEKNTELVQQKEELQTQSDFIAEVNSELTEKNTLITDSIYYAKRIQEAILPTEKQMKNYLTDFFIFYRPKDIVSGDFYGVFKNKNKIFIAVADCTGHGVPGAFMSMIGHTMLNDIIKSSESGLPSEILTKMNISVSASLNSDNNSNTNDDGMEITLCCIDIESNMVHIACANQFFFIVKENTFFRINGDEFSIGNNIINNSKISFTDHSYNIETISNLYMFSDGYSDQFGGLKDMKFLSARFEQLIFEIYNSTMIEQKIIIQNTFEKWLKPTEQNCKSYYQTDDVLVFGIKF